jgi:hypothetical protein
MIQTELTIQIAKEIAEDHIKRVIRNSERLSHYEFGPTVFDRENEWTWTFVSGSKQLQEEGCVPGAVFAVVDKSDGHVWDSEEQERFWLSRYNKS